VTQADDGSLVVATWNLVNPGSAGAPKTVRLDFKGLKRGATASIARVDGQHGDTLALYRAMGSPRYPTQVQIKDLRQKSELRSQEERPLENGNLNLELPPNGLAVIHVR